MNESPYVYDERFVPHALLKLLDKRSIEEVQLGDHKELELTVLFSDIRSFTALSEQLTPEQNFRFLNSYLSHMEPAVELNGGVIDKFIGDSIMALFGRADDAVRAASDMLRRLYAYNLGRLRAGYVPIRIGIGLNTGPVMLGIVGGPSRLQATVIGDPVNVASRVEAMNKQYGTSLLISGHTYQALEQSDHLCVRRIDRVTAKGKLHAVDLYEVFDHEASELRSGKLRTRPLFDEALQLFLDRRSAEAQPLFEQAVAACPHDLVARRYIRLCAPESQLWAETAASDYALEQTVQQLLIEAAVEAGASASVGVVAGDSTTARASAAVEASASAEVVVRDTAEADASAGVLSASEKGTSHHPLVPRQRHEPGLLGPLLDAVRMFLPYRAGFAIASEQGYAGDAARLEEHSVFLELRGTLGGLFVLSASGPAQEALLRSLLVASGDDTPPPAEERGAYLADAVAETANQLLGNALKLFDMYESYVEISPPLPVDTRGLVLRYDPSQTWGSIFTSTDDDSVIRAYFLQYRR